MNNDQALGMRFGTIRATSEYHYHHNPFYRRYGDTSGFRLDDLASNSDLVDVSWTPEHTFKGWRIEPGGGWLALWPAGGQDAQNR